MDKEPMNLEQLQDQLDNYRKYFNNRWSRPYPVKGTKLYLQYYPYVMKGRDLVMKINKFEADRIQTIEELSDNTVENIFL